MANSPLSAQNLIALLVAFFVVLATGPRVIAWLHKLKFGQNINTDAPSSHAKKQGTPTMGGVMIVIGVLVSLVVSLLLGHPPHPLGSELLAVTLVFIGHSAIGFLDDYLSIKRGKSLGLKARHKLLWQFVIAGGFVFWLYETALPGFTTQVAIWPGHLVDLGIAYYVIAMLFIMGLSNATNLTDGLDGLLGGLTIFAALGVSWTVYTLAPGFEQLPWFGYALAGGCLGFLWFNAHPAKVFMGDTGSLAIGASLAAMAIIGKQEILLLIFSLVFLLELFSVIIQVGVVRLTGGKAIGRRVFRRTPIHHHFEEMQWPETVVVARFWIVGVLALAVGLLLARRFVTWII
ncbi:phospho-N-acetylmuramoyl-pentapeptide-transferase [Capsulimonas corticalis]|uniref:Phospho-N-acetylmuramoyl-pentapeptide-transferase n=1 Tax=Capsulimonas corticalis TaxID=2219043 RepID=A0A402D328_9BACT|nr:phospho-N-acetylmuramoyl-pentapeptide-transferase [Capsulimonas corticalis]BDI28487.1 phospho-N-acetylmuramoyl-pentapeptide-transferase [Capsulimonas corticalis]